MYVVQPYECPLCGELLRMGLDRHMRECEVAMEEERLREQILRDNPGITYETVLRLCA